MHEHLKPLLPGFHPDPSICSQDGRFFLTTSSFKYFPGCPLFVSTNFRDWQQVGHNSEPAGAASLG
ncbi:MAG: family 43 glycosylhydrolase [Opitutales bacterium]